MRVEIERIEKKVEFEGFKLIIDVESLSELKDLHNRFNACGSYLNELCDNEWCTNNDSDVFETIDNELEKFE